jgi:hypothetical protein
VFGATGFVGPAESAILAGTLADINAAFGGNLNPGLSTPQGQLASSEAAIIGNANTQFAALANGVDPAYAAGRMQDAIGRIYYITRIPAAATVAQVLCNGLTGVSIPAGSLIQDGNGNLYAATAGGAIVAGGVTLSFACTVTGPIACAAQAFTLYQAIPGWDNAVSLAAGITGSAVETRSAFELRRSNSVAANAIGSPPSILGAVLSVAGVLDAYVIDNPSSSPVTLGGVTLVANSVYVAVSGGLAASVALAIWSKKSLGCNYNGNTTVTITDSTSGYSSPVPSYAVTFQIPTATTILFSVTIANSTAVPSNAAALVQAAIASAFVGGDGGPRARIGSTLYASRYYAPVAALGAWAQIISLLLGSVTPTLNDQTMLINQAPVCAAANVTVSFM